MANPKLPREAVPSSIGQLVTVQVFDLEQFDKTLVKPETLVKYVGILEAFWSSNKDFAFKIQGLPPVITLRQFKSVEIYIN